MHGLLRDKRRLDRMWVGDRAETFDGGDLMPIHIRHGRVARANWLAIHQDRAGPALPEPTTELGSVQLEVILQHI